MPTYVALLRAVNVGGTGKLPMAALRELCAAEGFGAVRTYIVSGNAVFTAAAGPDAVKAGLERRLADFAGRPVGVLVRTAAEMAEILAANPFPQVPGNRAVVLFLDGPPPPDTLETVKGLKDEELRLGAREIYIHYPDGQGVSKLAIPAAATGTARNMNTVAKLAEMAAEA